MEIENALHYSSGVIFFLALDNFLPVWSWKTIFGVDKHLPKGLPKMCQKFLSDPQNPPKWSEISDTEGLFGLQILDKILLSEPPRGQNGSKNTPRRLKKLFNVYFHCSDNFEWCRNFYGSRRLFENFDLWVKNFQKWPYLQNGQNHHFSTFDDFFFHFGQTEPTCPHLPNFASQKFLQAKGAPWKLVFWLKNALNST